jgi:hypothetical protein
LDHVFGFGTVGQHTIGLPQGTGRQSDRQKARRRAVAVGESHQERTIWGAVILIKGHIH